MIHPRKPDLYAISELSGMIEAYGDGLGDYVDINTSMYNEYELIRLFPPNMVEKYGLLDYTPTKLIALLNYIYPFAKIEYRPMLTALTIENRHTLPGTELMFYSTNTVSIVLDFPHTIREFHMGIHNLKMEIKKAEQNAEARK